MNREKLLLLLQKDSEIQETIRDICTQKSSDGKSDNLEKNNDVEKEIVMLKELVEKFKKCFGDEQNKTKDLTQKIDSKDDEIISLESFKKELKNEIKNLEEQKNSLQSKSNSLQTSNTNLNNTVEFYRKNFEDELKAYELYTNLGEQTKSSLSGIFKDDSLQGFFACGVQEKNINSFWEYIKVEILEDTNEDLAKLVKIFYFLFTKYSIAFPMFQLQKINPNDTFDTEQHIRGGDSKAVNGKISTVLFYGWVNVKTDKVVKKSIIQL